jgi:hypothetical protein
MRSFIDAAERLVAYPRAAFIEATLLLASCFLASDNVVPAKPGYRKQRLEVSETTTSQAQQGHLRIARDALELKHQ